MVSYTGLHTCQLGPVKLRTKDCMNRCTVESAFGTLQPTLLSLLSARFIICLTPHCAYQYAFVCMLRFCEGKSLNISEVDWTIHIVNVFIQQPIIIWSYYRKYFTSFSIGYKMCIFMTAYMTFYILHRHSKAPQNTRISCTSIRRKKHQLFVVVAVRQGGGRFVFMKTTYIKWFNCV